MSRPIEFHMSGFAYFEEPEGAEGYRRINMFSLTSKGHIDSPLCACQPTLDFEDDAWSEFWLHRTWH